MKVKTSVKNIKQLFRKYYAQQQSGRMKEERGKVEEVGYSGEKIQHTEEEKRTEGMEERSGEMEGIDLKNMERGLFQRLVFSIEGMNEEDIREINLSYPLIPQEPQSPEEVMAWARIYYDEKKNMLLYEVNEPPITLQDVKNIQKIKRIIENKIDVDFRRLKVEKAKDYLHRMINEMIQEFSIRIPPGKLDTYKYYIERDFLGLEKIEPLMNDPNIEDISCDGVNIPVYVFHRDPKIGSVRTNIKFNSKTDLDNFVIKLSQKCNKNLSVAEPLLEGALPDGSRVHAVLGTDVARKGSNFTIRKFSKEPLTPIKLIHYGTLDEKLLAYFWLAIENKMSLLVSGPTAAGKTSLLNALSMFIKPDAKIVSIEDTPELRLPHTHWVPEVERPGFGSYKGDKRTGEVSMFDLLKGALRQRPDYIIVGEVRGKEAFVLFQGMATGHAGLATLHADSIEKVIDRLITPPINLPQSLLETLDLIAFIKGMRYKNKFVRRVTNVYEIEKYDVKNKEVIFREVFEWSSDKDTFKAIKPSWKLKLISEATGMNKKEIMGEIHDRIRVLRWMYENNITDFYKVGEIINYYYYNKEALLDFIDSE